MARKTPLDLGSAKTGPRSTLSPAERTFVDLGQFTANSTVTKTAMLFDRAAVIREVWFVADAVADDADGTLLIDVHVRDKSEGAFDLIVDDFDVETLDTAFEAAEATLEDETSENELTVAAGDSVRVQLINNSAGIDTNANIGILIVYQTIEAVA